jgi:hypothetical protein
MIALRRNQGDYQASIGNGRGKRLTDEIRKEFDGLIGTEQQLRMARNEKVSSVTVTAISAVRAVHRRPQCLAGLPGPARPAGAVGSYAKRRPSSVRPSAWSTRPGCATARPSWPNRCWGS